MAARRLTRGCRRVILLALPAVALATALPSGAATPYAGSAPGAVAPAGAAAPLADKVKQRKKAVDQALADVREQLEGTNQDLVEAAVALKRTEAELQQANRDLAKARSEERIANKRYEDLAAKQRQAEDAESAANDLVAAGEADVARTREELGRFARQAYVSDDSTSQLSLALDATSPEAFAAAMSATQTALRLKKAAQDRLDAQLVENLQLSRQRQAATSQAEAYKEAAAAVAEEKQDAADRAAAAQARIVKLRAEQQAALRVIAARKAAEQARLDQLAREQTKLKQILAARAARALARSHGHGGIHVAGSGFLSMPADGPITSGFGWRFHPIFHVRRLHTGTDFGVGCGTTVRAAADGVVVLAGWAGGYGNRVVIDHGVVNGVSLATTYNHNSRLLVHPGQYVKRGQPVSISGTTGSSTGCHLHFEVLVNGGYVNPMGWL